MFMWQQSLEGCEGHFVIQDNRRRERLVYRDHVLLIQLPICIRKELPIETEWLTGKGSNPLSLQLMKAIQFYFEEKEDDKTKRE